MVCFEAVDPRDKYLASAGDHFMTGIQALVRMPLDQMRADRRRSLNTSAYITGYEGSPLGTYDLELARQKDLLEKHAIVFRPGLNEDLAATAVMGTQIVEVVPNPRYQGVVGYWYGKSPGLDRSGDALRHANIIGTSRYGGAVAVVGDDPTAKSSSIPGASELALFDLGMPTLYPSDVPDIVRLGLHAVAMSRYSGLWTGLKIVTSVADGSGTVKVDADFDPILDEDFRVNHNPRPMMIGASLQEMERSQHYVRLDAARRYIRLNELNRITRSAPGDRLGIAASGKAYLEVLEALSLLDIDDEALSSLGIRLLRINAPFPMAPETIREFADGLREIFVVEEKRAFVERFVKEALYSESERPRVVGKYDESGAMLLPSNGELSSDLLAKPIADRIALTCEIDAASLEERLGKLGPRGGLPELPVLRTPYFCSGCPHNVSTKVPEGASVGGGIGCSGLVMLMDEKQVGSVSGVTQMGGEGSQWIGMSSFTETPHYIQNLGDGTFAHSGSLAIRAAVASGANMTYKILFNSTVAMTGGQDPVGATTVEKLCGLLLLEGVARIIVTTDDTKKYRRKKLPRGVEVRHRDQLIEAQEELAKVPGVTVLIHDQACAAEKRRKRRRGIIDDPPKRLYINERVCEGCGDCGEKSNCLSLHPLDTEFGRKTRIDQTSCNKDYSCLKGDCPSFLEVIPAKKSKKATARVGALTGEELPDPVARSGPDGFGMRITGIGGTGVVTVAQILAVAASIEGRFVRGLDQTGMAQKGGPVVSDLRIFNDSEELPSKLAVGECDLYLGCDLLVAAEARNLAVADQSKTLAVISTAVVPTGSMVIDSELEYPRPETLLDRIRETVADDGLLAWDAAACTEALSGSAQGANIFLVGAAYQAGALPLAAESIEAAIELNGVAVDANIQAFRRGRQAVAAPADFAEALRGAQEKRTDERKVLPPAVREIVESVNVPQDSELARLVAIRVPELVEYQDRAYARKYAHEVERIRAIEAERAPSGENRLAEVVARNLFKLMAYKDEAEVARLSLDPRLQDALEAEFGPGARYRWKLHPPLLRALGLKRKLSFGPWFKVGFRLIYAMRRLRGTPFNPFGFGAVRRLERELIREYLDLLEEIGAALSEDNYEIAVRLADLPDMVRGYEEVKMRNADEYRKRLKRERSRLHDDRLTVTR